MGTHTMSMTPQYGVSHPVARGSSSTSLQLLRPQAFGYVSSRSQALTLVVRKQLFAGSARAGRSVKVGASLLIVCKSGGPGQPSPSPGWDSERIANQLNDGGRTSGGPEQLWSKASTDDGKKQQKSGSSSSQIQVVELLDTVWKKFLLPVLTNGSFIQAMAVAARTMVEHPQLLEWGKLPRLVLGLLALSLFQGYSAGLKLLFVEPSGINFNNNNKTSNSNRKVSLTVPVEIKDLSKPAAGAVVLGYGALGLAIVHFQFGLLTNLVYSTALLLTTGSSIPGLLSRFQKQPNLKLALITTVGGAAARGLLTTIGTYLALGPQSVSFSPALFLAMASFSVYSSVISVSKDGLGVGGGDGRFALPNVSLVALLGARTVCLAAAGAMLATLGVGVAAAVSVPWAFKPLVVVPGHLVLAAGLAFQLWAVNAANFSKPAKEGFYYRGLWGVYYGQCALLPFI